MPGELQSHGIAGVEAYATFLSDALAHVSKATTSIEPLSKSDFGDVLTKATVFDADDEQNDATEKIRLFAIIETAVRDQFSHLIATTPIESPDFVKVWNLLDLLSILSDEERCDPALLFWLIEELLDSQTIAGCRKIFDFLESRRERITAKHFKQKQLVILRSCNELLRRLSRAEDSAFCGRVFIFMFQSFPLGDKSSVNLRGEYHVENVTTFDQPLPKGEELAEAMDVDTAANSNPDKAGQKEATKAVTFDAKKTSQDDKPLEPDALYPLFWSLQESFSQPKRLFDSASFKQFRTELDATMKAFRAIQNDQGARPSKSMEDTKRGSKRKRADGDEEDNFTSAFNPKYLTSRDLFELEISDLSFRRHVLVQALIVMDFLLSLSSKAKEKLAAIKVPNKSVAYLDQLLSDDDAKWAADMKRSIADYLKQGFEGAYFLRMVETVLSRDKNWVRWKVENCPSIELPSVPADLYLDAKKTAQRTTTNKRLRATPLGSLSLNFLRDGDDEGAMERFKAKERSQFPELESLRRKIADDDFEIEMPTNNQTKAAAIEGKASKSWRALRIASRSRLASFDRIDDPDKIDPVFETRVDPDEEPDANQELENADAEEANAEEGGDGAEDKEAPEDTVNGLTPAGAEVTMADAGDTATQETTESVKEG